MVIICIIDHWAGFCPVFNTQFAYSSMMSSNSQRFKISAVIPSGSADLFSFSLFFTSWYSSWVKSSVLISRMSNILGISSSASVTTGYLPRSSEKCLYQLLSRSCLLLPFIIPFLADFRPVMWLISFQLSPCLDFSSASSTQLIISSRCSDSTVVYASCKSFFTTLQGQRQT